MALGITVIQFVGSIVSVANPVNRHCLGARMPRACACAVAVAPSSGAVAVLAVLGIALALWNAVKLLIASLGP
ncbi:hypothetical protein [Promicromonospora sp. NPDC090134]|uniref:hypothetical protein n=1 Tax=Promicromonospora sp. NPDC090134 TaxID=3364408 RepID=UPI00382337E1